jgi:hypothetical protein
MRTFLFNIFFDAFTCPIALVCHIVARTSTRDRLSQVIGFRGRTLIGAMRLIREHANGAVLAAAEDRFARGAGNEDCNLWPGM